MGLRQNSLLLGLGLGLLAIMGSLGLQTPWSQPTHTTADSDVTRALAEFDAWTKDRLNRADPLPPPAAAAEGQRLAGLRRQAMRHLIRHDPERAMALAASPQFLRRLPPDLARHFEQPVRGCATLRVFAGDTEGVPIEQTTREVILHGQRYEASVCGSLLSQVSTPKVALRGIVMDGFMAAHLDSPVPAALDEAGAPVAAADNGDGATTGNTGATPLPTENAWTQGPKKLLFLRVNFPDDLSEPMTEADASALLAKAKAWYEQNSYGLTVLIPTVTPLLTLPRPKGYYSALGYNPGSGPSTLLVDAREAARAAGYDPDDYALEVLRHGSMPGFSYTGLGVVRGKGLWLQCSSSDVLIHELGHNFGLWHANFWSATQDSVVGPGSHYEYGDPFDIMGTTSNAEEKPFSAIFKNHLRWLPDRAVHTITTSGVYRVYASDVTNLVDGRGYAFRVRKDLQRHYWGEFRTRTTSNPWLCNGLLLRWSPWSLSGGGTHLLDTNPGTPEGKNDSAVTLGCTFSDPGAGIHITPIARGGSDADCWIDCQVQLGAFADNRPPTLRLEADRSQARLGEAVTLTATASDPDGDELSYAWGFGDQGVGPNTPSASKSWSSPNDYVVRCVASDTKGGQAVAWTLVRVGSAAGYRVSGRITDRQGNPIQGVRVNNGRGWPIYRGAYTDAEGRYTITFSAASSHQLTAVKYGYALTPAGSWANPVAVWSDLSGLDFSADPLPTVRVAAADASAAELAYGKSDAAVFTITRAGPTDSPLAVKLNLGGAATCAVDYLTHPSLNDLGDTVVIPAGSASLEVGVYPLVDAFEEGMETVVLSLLEDPNYVLAPLAEANIRILDQSAFGNGPQPTLAVAGPDPGSTPPAAGARSFVLSFKRPLPPVEVRYEIETSEDLFRWRDCSNELTEILPPLDDGNQATETARFWFTGPAASDTKRFFRLRLTAQ